ncbi:24529_t:CDS:1, partial [Dentiscutata erythropus]
MSMNKSKTKSEHGSTDVLDHKFHIFLIHHNISSSFIHSLGFVHTKTPARNTCCGILTNLKIITGGNLVLSTKQ